MITLLLATGEAQTIIDTRHRLIGLDWPPYQVSCGSTKCGEDFELRACVPYDLVKQIVRDTHTLLKGLPVQMLCDLDF